MTVNEQAPAKINLGLSISGRRADGYHDILSIFQTVSLCDDLMLRQFNGVGLTCSNSDISAGPDNLVLRAEELFCTRFGITESVHFILEKRIPVGGGLAGGSSDAAASLRGLRCFHGLDVDDVKLEDVSAGLGSDIPFLIKGGTAVVSGRGEVVKAVRWPFDFTYILVYPGFGVSTAWAYQNLGEYGHNCDVYHAVTVKLMEGNLTQEEFFSALSNDFEHVVFRRYPVLAKIKNDMMDYGAQAALLTGSGSTLLGIFEKNETANECVNKLKKDNLEIFVVKKFPAGF